MDALTHRLAAALGNLLNPINGRKGDDHLNEMWDNARKVHAEYDQRCREQAGIDHYHGREGG